jgi:hypothetical protein
MPGYKTMILELLQDQYPALHERLRQERKLPATLDRLAIQLKDAHKAWMNELRRASPGRDFGPIASEALELAIEHLRGTLPCEPPPTAGPDETCSLDAAMAYLRRHTPPA